MNEEVLVTIALRVAAVVTTAMAVGIWTMVVGMWENSDLVEKAGQLAIALGLSAAAGLTVLSVVVH